MSDARVRRAVESDVEAMVGLVYELAEYERAPEQCHLTAEQLHRALFGPRPALFAHVAEAGGEVVGCALWFLNYSTWDGEHGIYLEDLYVRPTARGGGLGRALLGALAQECVQQGYTRLQWWVLDWNEPAIGFYHSLGAVPMDDWTVYRVTGDALDQLAVNPSRP
ncbi:GNAT family N-acetyltransferase [Actinophytocola xinjiangensis]|uniref:GNAT family N-acetyltransferase n=1 Tax=Actinophytocola xinjiangensis TaxID=485602 RepID=A0A7Z0WHV2_9PSEU|nr:GNAT family N-acetyltransferase [Actinophytocola xinjiangensis]OLF06539.1 GNAT family N-acetyltransferase [Actinophytocola xinjiangensis]